MPRTLCVLLWARPGAHAALTAYEDRVLRLARTEIIDVELVPLPPPG
jgi:hypothetical protein